MCFSPNSLHQDPLTFVSHLPTVRLSKTVVLLYGGINDYIITPHLFPKRVMVFDTFVPPIYSNCTSSGSYNVD